MRWTVLLTYYIFLLRQASYHRSSDEYICHNMHIHLCICAAQINVYQEVWVRPAQLGECHGMTFVVNRCYENKD